MSTAASWVQFIQYVSWAYVKFMSCLSLSRFFSSVSEDCFVQILILSENCVSEAYARHMQYIQAKDDEKNDLEWVRNSDSICHEISICWAFSEQDFILCFRLNEIATRDWVLISICSANADHDLKYVKDSELSKDWTLMLNSKRVMSTDLVYVRALLNFLFHVCLKKSRLI